jgi:16S rRNA (cytosine967-C5)-methyltransferase
MRPAALLGIALELIEELARAGALPADARVGKFWRARRYLGSTDRRAIGAAAYAWLRHAPRASARWNAWVAGDRSPPAARRAFQPRQARLAEVLVLAADGLFPWSFRETAAAARELAPPAGEPPGFWGPVQDLLAGDFLDGDPWPAEPGARLAAELSLPAWLARRLVEERGEEEARRLGLALLERAPLDLRVNLRCASREEARRSLEAETGVTVAPTPHSPLGLRLQERANIAGAAAVRRGWIEVEDEGSQLVAQALDPVPGTTVIDACAGAGGKTLALADILLRAGDPTAAGAAAAAPRLFACDTAAA